MANKHFDQAPTHATASIRFNGSVVPCAVISVAEATAHVRVFSAGAVPEDIILVQDGEERRARIAVRKQGPLGLDLWLDLPAAQTTLAA